MKESVDFSYDGIRSNDMGLLNIDIDSSGLFNEQFISEREIQEVTIRGRDKPYLQGVKRVPLSLSLSFAFKNTYDDNKIREVARWLDKNYYKPFFTLDNPGRIFRCLLVSKSSLLHNGLKNGYVTLEMRCDSPYTYSPEYLSPLYDFSVNGVLGSPLTFVNFGDIICKPEIWITKIGNGNVSIVNYTNGGREFKFTNLLDGETVYVDSDREVIESDIINTYRYDNFNDKYLQAVRGVNNLTVFGNCKIQMRYEFMTLQG